MGRGSRGIFLQSFLNFIQTQVKTFHVDSENSWLCSYLEIRYRFNNKTRGGYWFMMSKSNQSLSKPVRLDVAWNKVCIPLSVRCYVEAQSIIWHENKAMKKYRIKMINNMRPKVLSAMLFFNTRQRDTLHTEHFHRTHDSMMLKKMGGKVLFCGFVHVSSFRLFWKFMTQI
jgi:hypothetical protein